MIQTVFLNLIYLFFPITCYFIYLVYSKIVDTKEKVLFLDLALFSSYYLCFKYGEFSNETLLLINLPLIIALYNKRTITAIFISICSASLMSNFIGIDLYYCLLQYIIIFVFYFLTNIKLINIMILSNLFFSLYVLFFTNSTILPFNDIFNVIQYLVIMYILFIIVIKLYAKVENIVNMHNSIKEITREKKLYESLFKITHEIKNPLAVCRGYLDMFDIKNPAKANKYIGIIGQEVDRTLVLLKDFSDISKITITKNIMDASMLIEDVSDEVGLLFNDKVKFESKIFVDNIIINGDYNRLKQVIINLIKNAKEAVKESGKVSLYANVIKNQFVITIVDDGEGMDKETLDNLGNAFYTTKKFGSGLGICLSKEILNSHGATINYDSKLGVGTTVKVKIPIYKEKRSNMLKTMRKKTTD